VDDRKGDTAVIIEVNDLSFRYRSAPILDRVGFRVSAGEMVMILGPNGVGKSTLLKCLHGALRPAGGSILLEGRSLESLSPPEIARVLGYVPQRTEPARLTAFDAVLLGRKPHMGWKVTERDLKAAGAALQSLGIESLGMRPLDEMSGGEMQKVALARALVQEPRVLLLDEPTSSLDLRAQVEILETLHHIVAGHGLAAVMTFHDLNTAFRYGDRFLFLKDGVIAHAGTRDSIDAAIIEEVYGLEVDLLELDGCPVVIPRRGRRGTRCASGTRDLTFEAVRA
jgi:iron complex transport system ATP-binding protein